MSKEKEKKDADSIFKNISLSDKDLEVIDELKSFWEEEGEKITRCFFGITGTDQDGDLVIENISEFMKTDWEEVEDKPKEKKDLVINPEELNTKKEEPEKQEVENEGDLWNVLTDDADEEFSDDDEDEDEEDDDFDW
ncbi:hypothetical protein [Candidatus Mycoplasma haematohominis]|uniref:hypothetical protein n=1 Tax=Candidatus Mycoplasma haematohominis TaxID=1494318 RepID=UPI001C0A711A|nr:hypothetical protein [Candidatus Mycoplasma haemohominis]